MPTTPVCMRVWRARVAPHAYGTRNCSPRRVGERSVATCVCCCCPKHQVIDIKLPRLFCFLLLTPLTAKFERELLQTHYDAEAISIGDSIISTVNMPSFKFAAAHLLLFSPICALGQSNPTGDAPISPRSPPYFPSPVISGAGDWAQAYVKAKGFVDKLTLLEKGMDIVLQ